MNTEVAKILNAKEKRGVELVIPVTGFQMNIVPGLGESTRVGTGFIKVTDLPNVLDRFMRVNPRVPSRLKSGSLSGPIIKGILDTLANQPEEMALKNQGVYILVDDMETKSGTLYITLSDAAKHGIVNGGHTYAAIQQAIETFEGEQLARLSNAYVKLHILEGVPRQIVADIAEGLNRSKQVDDLSLSNLQGEFNYIKDVLRSAGIKDVSFKQGDKGHIDVSEILVYLGMFDIHRFSDLKHPNSLYNKSALGLRYFNQNMQNEKAYEKQLIQKIGDILWLVDSIRKEVPESCKRNHFKFGLARVDGDKRAGSQGRKTYLPFLDQEINYKVPNGWVYPMVAAFRANLRDRNGELEWIIPIHQLLPEVMDGLTSVIIKEHKDSGMRPDIIGKKESAYARCYAKMQLYLARKGVSND